MCSTEQKRKGAVLKPRDEDNYSSYGGGNKRSSIIARYNYRRWQSIVTLSKVRAKSEHFR
jgi:hypothetical protein